MRSIKFDELQQKAGLPRPVSARAVAPTPVPTAPPPLQDLPGAPPPALRLDPKSSSK